MIIEGELKRLLQNNRISFHCKNTAEVNERSQLQSPKLRHSKAHRNNINEDSGWLYCLLPNTFNSFGS